MNTERVINIYTHTLYEKYVTLLVRHSCWHQPNVTLQLLRSGFVINE
jgi:hypothetical protein